MLNAFASRLQHADKQSRAVYEDPFLFFFSFFLKQELYEFAWMKWLGTYCLHYASISVLLLVFFLIYLLFAGKETFQDLPLEVKRSLEAEESGKFLSIKMFGDIWLLTSVLSATDCIHNGKRRRRKKKRLGEIVEAKGNGERQEKEKEKGWNRGEITRRGNRL